MATELEVGGGVKASEAGPLKKDRTCFCGFHLYKEHTVGRGGVFWLNIYIRLSSVAGPVGVGPIPTFKK